MGGVFLELGATHKATSYYEQAFQMFHTIGDQAGASAAWEGLKIAGAAASQPVSSSSHHVTARTIPYSKRDLPPLDDASLNYSDADQAQQSIGRYELLLEEERAFANQGVIGVLRAHIGAAAAALGDTERAVIMFQQARELLRDAGNTHGAAVVASNLAKLFEMRGDLARAITLLQERIDVERTVDPSNVEWFEHQIGRLQEQVRAQQRARHSVTNANLSLWERIQHWLRGDTGK